MLPSSRPERVGLMAILRGIFFEIAIGRFETKALQVVIGRT